MVIAMLSINLVVVVVVGGGWLLKASKPSAEELFHRE
jgi:hypothetical protein